MSINVAITETTITVSRQLQTQVNASITSAPISVTVSNVDHNSHPALSIGSPANGLSVVAATQVLSIALASSLLTGALSSTDWTTFNNKQNALGYTPVNVASAEWIDLTDGGATTLHSHAGGTGHTIQDEGTSLTARTNLNFVGANVTVTDDAGNNATVVTISGGGTITGSGTTGQIVKWTGATALGDAALIPPASNILTLTNAAASTLALNITSAKTLTLTSTDDFNLTVPATGTVALLATANVFTATQKINVNSTTAFFVEQDGVKDNVLVVDTTNARIGINKAPSVSMLDMPGSTTDSTIKAGTFELQSYAINNAWLTDNAYYNSGFKYRSNGKAAAQYFEGGGFEVRTAIFGTTNSAITWAIPFVVTVGKNVALGGHIQDGATTELFIGSTLVVLAPSSTPAGDGKVGINNSAPSVTFHPIGKTTTTNAIKEVGRLEAIVSTASTGGAAGFGPSQTLWAETATDGTNKQQGRLWSKWIVATNGSETSAVGLDAYTNSTAQEFISGEGNSGGVKLSFYGGTRVARGAALTTQLTTITHTSPGTPDYAIQDMTMVAPWGFASQDEGNTVLSVIRNLQIRVAELEARLGSATGVNLFA